jgi:hypothetical protein
MSATVTLLGNRSVHDASSARAKAGNGTTGLRLLRFQNPYTMTVQGQVRGSDTESRVALGVLEPHGRTRRHVSLLLRSQHGAPVLAFYTPHKRISKQNFFFQNVWPERFLEGTLISLQVKPK